MRSDTSASSQVRAQPRPQASSAEPSNPASRLITSQVSMRWPFWNGISTSSISGMVR